MTSKTISLTTILTTAVLAAGTGAAPSASTESSRSPTSRGAAVIPIQTLPRPEDFVARVTNRYYPLKPGTGWVYRSVTPDGIERIRVKVLPRTKLIEGIEATVVRDTATLDGQLIEDTFDWYAQDRLGNVWYLGEATTAYEDGQPVSTEGSWEAGVDGAKAGFALPTTTSIDEPYRQEFKAGEAEDEGVVLDKATRVRVTAGRYRRVWMTKDTTSLEPNLIEYKFYAPGVGQVLELGVSPDQERVQLVRFKTP